MKNDRFYSESLLNKLFETNVRFNTEIDLDKVEKAIFYAQKYHCQQKRDTGELYYTHPLEVAYMVADYSFETDTIITAILHDTLEDTTLTKEKIVKDLVKNCRTGFRTHQGLRIIKNQF
ncbi:HD domain protein [Orientia tsutsugamushi str. UT76]|nr:HD domain protein [Orientia tsutsugamushi str. UT76]